MLKKTHVYRNGVIPFKPRPHQKRVRVGVFFFGEGAFRKTGAVPRCGNGKGIWCGHNNKIYQCKPIALPRTRTRSVWPGLQSTAWCRQIYKKDNFGHKFPPPLPRPIFYVHGTRNTCCSPHCDFHSSLSLKQHN